MELVVLLILGFLIPFMMGMGLGMKLQEYAIMRKLDKEFGELSKENK